MQRDLDPDPTRGTLPAPKDAFLRASGRASGLLHTLRNSRVLFYPGAGSDISPALRFAAIGAIDTVLYCDYIDRVPRVDFEMMGHYRAREDRDVHASELRQHCRADFFPAIRHPFGRRNDDESNPVIGRVMELQSYGPDEGRLTFIYLDTEAIQTYIHVWGAAGLAPLLVVVQDHGKGGLWTQLGGDCLMYTAAPVLPQFLWVGSEAWPHYNQISRPDVDHHSLHRNERTLWECTLPDRINPDSPLRFLVASDQAVVDPNR
ncbi:MAG: hypothetical protein FJ275_12630, partial [Planctomycetes bacterium]|nr:hypothetical protein [Planctomycetota bacterium]